jgi:hypothetical protein
MSQEDAYGMMRWGGEFESAMNERIPVYKLGSGVEDDDSLLGCLTMRKGQSESVKLFHFGQINSTDRIRQSVIDGRYEMYLEMV